jgi:DNA-binding transcriptional regulator YiaG
MGAILTMTRQQFIAALKRLGLSQVDFATMWGTTPQVVNKWGAERKGGNGVPYWVGPALELMGAVQEGSASQPALLLTPKRR